MTLSPSASLPPNQFFRITIDGQASPLLHNGLTDLAGNQLAGSSGAPGTPEVVTFGLGTKLVYTDSGGNLVTLQLAKGGMMQMFLAPTGSVLDFALIGTVPGKSTLTGTVKRQSRSSGRTYLPAIAGAAGTRIKLKRPPFIVASSADAATTAHAAADRALVRVSHGIFSGRRWQRDSRTGARAHSSRP